MRSDRNRNGRADDAGGRDSQADGSDRASTRGGAAGTGASHLFLVRLWHEQVDEGEGAEAHHPTQTPHSQTVRQDVWRGKVQHVLSGRSGRFDDLQESLVDVLLSLLPPEEDAGGGQQPGPPAGSQGAPTDS